MTVLADRGFGDTKLYAHLYELGFDFIVRFRGNIKVANSQGETKSANEWVSSTGRATLIKDAFVPEARFWLPSVVVKRESKMKEAWCLAVSRADVKAQEAVQLYGLRVQPKTARVDGRTVCARTVVSKMVGERLEA